jgi:hypothetical protein
MSAEMAQARRSTDDGDARRGAYGLHLPDLPDAAELLLAAPSAWIDWRIVRLPGEGQPSEFVEDARARLRAEPDGWVDVDLASASSTFSFPTAPGDRAMVHPYLASTASVVARWQGLQSFHAGAFVAGGRAWALLGQRGAGKSSLLAHLALGGVPVLTDDVLVVRGMLGLAGPRCIDLRHATAERLGVGEALGVVGTRERWRLRTGPVEPEVPLGGWICLEWGERTIETMVPSHRLAAIFASLSLRVAPRDPSALMELLALPAFVLRQPQDVEELSETAERLLEHLDAAVA